MQEGRKIQTCGMISNSKFCPALAAMKRNKTCLTLLTPYLWGSSHVAHETPPLLTLYRWQEPWCHAGCWKDRTSWQSQWLEFLQCKLNKRKVDRGEVLKGTQIPQSKNQDGCPRHPCMATWKCRRNIYLCHSDIPCRKSQHPPQANLACWMKAD